MEQPYIPISCSFYDYLEQAATLGNKVVIEFLEGQEKKIINSRIKTLAVKDKVEYMILENNEHIRLDFLISFDGKLVPQTC